jgi:hypothetical protein
MANIPTTTTDGSVSSTQNPQAGGQATIGGGTTKTIQGTNSSNVLSGSSSSNSIQLNNTTPDFVTISSTSTEASTAPKSTAPYHRTYSTGVVFVVVLVVIAIVAFLNITRSSKITTQ